MKEVGMSSFIAQFSSIATSESRPAIASLRRVFNHCNSNVICSITLCKIYSCARGTFPLLQSYIVCIVCKY